MKTTGKESDDIIEHAKLQHWNDFCNSDVKHCKDMGKVWDELKVMKNGITSPQYPIKIDNSNLPCTEKRLNAF